VGDPSTIFALTHASGTLTLDGLARLAALGDRRVFAEGEELMRQGDVADSLFVILEGQVRVVREHPHLSTPITLAALGAGEVVGEMGLLDGEPRSATVTALEETVAMRVPEHALRLCVARHPDVYGSLLKVLSKRLRSTNDLAAEMAVSGTNTDPPPEVST
jgi:CRP/FNR family transcriptional regulator, cyclic AMP receptor protein